MANEIKLTYASGSTVYARIRNAAGQIYSTVAAAFETWNNVNVANYDITLTDMGGGIYIGDFPVIALGRYVVELFLQSGGVPATDDTIIGTDEIVWNGASEENIIDSYGYVKAGGWG